MSYPEPIYVHTCIETTPSFEADETDLVPKWLEPRVAAAGATKWSGVLRNWSGQMGRRGSDLRSGCGRNNGRHRN